MRHRAPRRPNNLRYRLPRATALLLGRAAGLRARGVLVAVVVVLSLGTAVYAALASVSGGASNRQAESAGSTVSRDDSQNTSRDVERPKPTGAPSTPDHPAPSASSSVSRKPAATQPADRRASASPSTSVTVTGPSASATATGPPPSTTATGPSATATGTPEDNSPPSTSLSETHLAGDAATFSFSADEPASFTCSLDGAAYASCGSAVSYSDLAPGWHTFAVRATDAAGNVDPTPAQTRWHATGGWAAR
jgi:hypothetical protein